MIKRPNYEGPLTPAVEHFVNEVLTELAHVPETKDYIQALKCPVIKAPITAITLLGLSMIGEYAHPDEEIEGWVRKNLEQMHGSFKIAIAQLFSAVYMGTSAAEWFIRKDAKEWKLGGIQILDSRLHLWDFMGSLGKIDYIRYYGQEQIDIPYNMVLHVVNNPHLALSDPRGVSDLDTAIAAVKAWKIIVAEMVVAGKRQATPLTAGYYDDEAPDIEVRDSAGQIELDANGDPVYKSAGQEMAEQMEGLENRTVVVTAARNKIEAIANQADSGFFVEALRYLHKIIYLSLLFPETGLEVIGSGGSGDSNLNKGHMALLRQNIETLANQMKEEILEKMIRPLIEWNFGEQEDYGSFPSPEHMEEQRVEVFNALLNAFTSQVFTLDDLQAINKLRSLVGLEPQEETGDRTPEPNIPTEEELEESENFSLNGNYWRLFEQKNGHHPVKN